MEALAAFFAAFLAAISSAEGLPLLGPLFFSSAITVSLIRRKRRR